MVAAVASDEPQMAPNPAAPVTEASARPPRRWPIQARAAVKRVRFIPDCVANWPIRRKSGMTAKLWVEARKKGVVCR